MFKTKELTTVCQNNYYHYYIWSRKRVSGAPVPCQSTRKVSPDPESADPMDLREGIKQGDKAVLYVHLRQERVYTRYATEENVFTKRGTSVNTTRTEQKSKKHKQKTQRNSTKYIEQPQTENNKHQGEE